MAYAALLRNELLGAGIESVPNLHTEDRRHTVFSQDTHSLFRVRDGERETLSPSTKPPIYSEANYPHN